MSDPQTAGLIAKIAMRTNDAAHRRAMLAMLARRLGGDWHRASAQPEIVKVIEYSLADSESRRVGIALAAATRDRRYEKSLKELAENAQTAEETRVAAVEGLRAFPGSSEETLTRLIESVRGKSSSSSVAEAAVRTIAGMKNEGKRLIELLSSRDYPLGLRREALRGLARVQDGGRQILDLASAGKLPADLKNDATTLVHTDSNRRIRDQASKVLPMPKTAGGQSLPSIGELVRQQGDAEKGRAVFFRTGTTSCAGCHRVQGRGQWVGPDLSTIGVKYGRDELIRSILSPSDSIGFSYRSVVAALADGRVVTGLAVEDTPLKLVLKTADGQRVSVEPRSIEDRRTSDVSLMPEGLAQTMTTQEVVDLLSYLTTLRRPVSIVGQYQAIGPIHEQEGRRLIDPTAAIDLRKLVGNGRGRGEDELSWRRLGTNAEGQADLSLISGGDAKAVAYMVVPVVSPEGQQANLVIDTAMEVLAWINGKPVDFSANRRDQGEPRTAIVELPKGASRLVMRLLSTGGAQALVTTTLISDRPVGFDADAVGSAGGGQP